jgi:formate dehydrogenase iron-sulfur subunit
MMSDVCKHCVQAGCLEVCPTGAIIRTEFDTVVIQASACNGCRACLPACPFGVIGVSEVGNIAQKCTLCYDRLKEGLVPSCAQACPTQSIAFGPVKELRKRAEARVKALHEDGRTDAYIYGDETILGGLNSFYLLVDKPEVYGLPASPKLPSRNLAVSSIFSAASAALVGIAALVGLRSRRSASPIPGATPHADNGDTDGPSAV